MRSTVAALTMTSLVVAACGGEQRAPLPPPAPPPPPVTAAAAAPSDTQPPPPPPKPSLTELIPQTMKGISEAFNAHDSKKMSTFFTEDCVTSEFGMPAAHGRDEAMRGLQGFFDIVGDVKSNAQRVWVKGNVVVEEIVWAGTMTGDFMGMKASNKPMGELRVHIMWVNDDGLVKEIHEYGDDATLMAQMTGKRGAPPVPTVPTNPPQIHFAKSSPDEEKLEAWAKSMDETLGKHDAKAALARFADDADYWLNVTGMPATKGKKDLARDVDGWLKAFPDQKWASTNVWGVDGYAILEHALTGAQKGRIGPLAASGKQVNDWHWVDILQPSADGKVQHGWGYANLMEMMQQTGALRPAGEAPGAAGKASPADAAANKKK